MNLSQQAIDQILGNAAVGHEFGDKIKELDRRLSMNGMSYSGYDSLTDRQQEIFTQGLFLEPESAMDIRDYVVSAVDNCGCPDVVEELHHHSPMLMREIEAEQEKLPDMTIRIGEGISGLDQAIDLLLEQIIIEQINTQDLGENTPATSDFKSLVKKIFETNNIRIGTMRSDTAYHIRAESPIPNSTEIKDLKPWFAKFNIDVEEYNPSISGKYDTLVLTTKENITADEQKNTYKVRGSLQDIPAGTSLFYVPLVLVKKEGKTQRYVKDKALSPSPLGLGSDSRVWESTSEITQIAQGSINEKYPPPTYPEWVAPELISLLSSAQAQGTVVRFEKDLQFGNDDLKVISKDYGETLSALWTMSQAENEQFNLPYQGVNFPSNPAEKLVDFYGFTEQVLKIPVSVKSGKVGGKVQITNVIESARVLYEISEGVEGALPEDQQFIAVAATNDPKHEATGRTQSIYIHKILVEDPANPDSAVGTRTIKKLAEIMSATGMPTSWEDVTRVNVQEWLDSKSEEELIGNRMPEIKDEKYVEPKLPEDTEGTGILEPLWAAANSKPDLAAFKKNKRDKMLLVCSPLGSQAEKMLNESVAIQNELNRLAQTLTVIQANVNAKKKVLTFQLNKFKDATFVFKWPGYISGNYMGFLMNINK